MMSAQNAWVSCQIIEIVHNDGNKQIQHLKMEFEMKKYSGQIG